MTLQDRTVEKTGDEQSDGDRAAIQRGITDMEAGRVVTLEELDGRVESRINGMGDGQASS